MSICTGMRLLARTLFHALVGVAVDARPVFGNSGRVKGAPITLKYVPVWPCPFRSAHRSIRRAARRQVKRH
jgi:hypothetical protein